MGEKKRRLSSGEAATAQQRELLAKGIRAMEAGDHARGQAAYRQLMQAEATAQDAAFAADLGALGLHLGDAANAERLLQSAVSAQAQNAGYRCNLAIALRQLGRRDEAIAQLQHALRIDPRLVQVHVNLGNALMDGRRFDEAAAAFERALATKPAHADALYGLANAQLALERREDGCANLHRALVADPGFHQAHACLAAARMNWAAELAAGGDTNAADEQIRQSMSSISAALRLLPENPLYWLQFADCMDTARLRHPLGASMRELLLRALDHPVVRTGGLVRAVIGLVKSHPGAATLRSLMAPSGSDGSNTPDWGTSGATVRDVLAEPLLLKVLSDGLVADVFIERLLLFARRAMLDEVLAQAVPSLPDPVIATLAHHGFNAEYAGAQTAQEASGLAILGERLSGWRASGQAVPSHWYAVYGAYRPLYDLDGAPFVGVELADTPFREVAQRQIREPEIERALRANIPSLTPAAAGVSAAVRAQYEANPYPRWIRPVRLLESGTVEGVMQGLFPHAGFGATPQTSPRILVAGCGTGQHPIDTAQRFSGASVLAVDLSLTSLAYARRKTQQLGLANIEYRQGDILALGSLTERFDVVECAGVLHHLEDPMAGWRVLCGLLRQGGVMRIALYSEIARRHVVHAREFIRAGGHESTVDGIRRCRAAILANSDDPLLQQVALTEDFYSLSGCRDLMFHVQEHRFTLPQIASCLDALGLEFLGFELPDATIGAQYRAAFPGDAAMLRLDDWHRFEADHPDTFAAMYQFWVRSPGAQGPIGRLGSAVL